MLLGGQSQRRHVVFLISFQEHALVYGDTPSTPPVPSKIHTAGQRKWISGRIFATEVLKGELNYLPGTR